MDNFQVRNSPALRKFLQEQAQQAQRAIIEWQEFANRHTEVKNFTTAEQWYAWAANQTGIDRYLWVGRELEVVSYDLAREQPQQTERPQAEASHHFGHASGGHKGGRYVADIVENSWDYQKVEYELQNKWLKDNGQKNFKSKEGIDFLYGSLDSASPSLHEETMKELQLLALTSDKLADKLDKYKKKAEEAKENFLLDDDVQLTNNKITRHLDARLTLYEKENPKATKEEKETHRKELLEKIRLKAWEQFAIANPKKASEYAKTAHDQHNEYLKKALVVINKRKEEEEKKEETPSQQGLVDIKKYIRSEEIQVPRRRDVDQAVREMERPVNQTQSAPQTQDTPPSQPEPQAAQRSSPARSRASRIPINPSQLAALGRAAGTIGILGNPVFWIGLFGLIFIFVSILLFSDSGEGTQAFPAPPTPGNPLQIGKGVNKTEFTVNDTIEYSLKVSAHSLAGEQITVTEKIPSGTVFVSTDSDANVNGDTVTWNLNASRTTRGDRPIPAPQQPPPQELIRSVQRVSVTEEQIRQELVGLDSPYAQYASTVFDVGQKHTVDPAFIMAVWRMESAYGLVGGYVNNPGSIVYVRDGYLGGMKQGRFNHGRYWATWDTFEQGLEAIALLIKNEYYPLGQTDTWGIHSGIGPAGTHAYHGRGDIGIGDVQTWADYVRFYYNWITVMDRVGGGNYSIDKTLTLSVRPTADNIWVANKSTGFSPGNGEASSNEIVVKVGNPSEESRPGTPIAIPPAPTRPQDIQKALDENFSVQVTPSPLLTQTHLTWMWEALWKAKQKTPNFFPLLKSRFTAVRIVPINGTSETDNSSGTIKLGPGTLNANKELFQQIFIHELGHIIHGFAGSATGQPYDQAIRSAWQAEGQLTRYSRENEDEAFAELVSYYVLEDIVEQPTRYRDVKWPSNNPLKTNVYPRHQAFIEGVLGK